jgi:glycogen operon protein
MGLSILPGKPHPLGAAVRGEGVNFCVYSESATAMEILLFADAEDAEPSEIVALDPRRHRTHHYWHAFLYGIGEGQLYGYRCHGPREPSRGLRFDGEKLLLDPYARAVSIPKRHDRAAASRPGANIGAAPKGVVMDARGYDWEGDEPLRRPFSQTVIYEMHVAGFTKHPSSGVAPDKRGTYAGVVEKIPYLLDLGVTAVELLPVFQFDPQDAPEGLTNYWGYTPLGFFAPHAGYCSCSDPLGPLVEFRDMVKALHRAGIEVILDVVFNHTTEGDELGPTYSLRGLQNDVYYILDEDRSRYANYSGTGNTLNANHPVVRRMILDSVHFWVTEMHVDGFRFDLASILTRDENGQPLKSPPVLLDVDTDPVLAGTKLIAEAWDAGGLYQVGSFVGDFWKEWNGRFRDDVRSFVRGDDASVENLAARLMGSPDIYAHRERGPDQSINFVTCHDGFTLQDLVSYDRKHNEANREGNRDGSDDNRSWNCGVEGPTEDPDIERLRNRQVKNFLALNLLALGVPMLTMGDEIRRTQSGNNNPYCQDDETSWMDWTLLERHADVHRFAKRLVEIRLSADLAEGDDGLTLAEILNRARFRWHGVRLNQPDWSDTSHSLACTVSSVKERYHLHVIASAFWKPLTFDLPLPPVGRAAGWGVLVDTARDSPEDAAEAGKAPVFDGERYTVGPRSVVVLVARSTEG